MKILRICFFTRFLMAFPIIHAIAHVILFRLFDGTIAPAIQFSKPDDAISRFRRRELWMVITLARLVDA